MLLHGDISSNALEHFSIIIGEIFAPLLNNPLNQINWPKLLKNDMIEKFHNVLENVAVVKGTLNNKTFLPLPINIQEVLDDSESIING